MLAFNRSDNVTFPGVVSGSAARCCNSARVADGHWIETLRGGTTITAGTLSVGSGGTFGILPGNTTDNSVLVFNRC